MTNEYNFTMKYVIGGRYNKSLIYRFRIFLAERINSVLIPKSLTAYTREEIVGLIKFGRRVK